MPIQINSNGLTYYLHSVEETTGWKRPSPLTLLTDTETLEKISTFNYDLTNPGFVKYARSRGCMNGAGWPGENDPDYSDVWPQMVEEANKRNIPISEISSGRLRKYAREHWLGYSGFSSDFKEEKEPAKKNMWQCLSIERAKLQDCWEIYIKNIHNI